ncbi:pyruvate kinase [Desulforegula conservatrix]|uniref:pyruvate kinase n=1 Tax=Desulforegula conservatrix TaxID=153026 RepID=UPI000429307C|nr:pyruvate kinase [Desulforegula conservatrix]
MPRTKIICTIGPSSSTPEIIKAMIQEGMNVARLNFSHGTHEQHAEKIVMIRKVADELGKHVAILQDLCGPKIRIGLVKEPGIRLDSGSTLILTTEILVGEDGKVSVSYKNLPRDVKSGDIILLADGMMELAVREIKGDEIFCTVITGGVLTSNKGINLPSGTISTPSLTDKDKADLEFGLKHDIDFVALSFVRRASDIHEARQLIIAAGKDVPIIAKIEKHEAIESIDAIIDACDAVMVARGDLGVEIPLENVPVLQKEIVKKANLVGKPVIIATQMLRSMVDSPRPTRAEATDVANAVLDGADAVMLSEETASGQYPVKAIQYMARIAETAEKTSKSTVDMSLIPEKNIEEAVAYASCVLAENLGVSAIVAPTSKGFTAMLISKFRPKAKIIALSPDISIVRRLSLYWGCFAKLTEQSKNTDDMIEDGAKSALETGLVSKGDLIVITAGHPVWVAGTTNMVKVKRL